MDQRRTTQLRLVLVTVLVAAIGMTIPVSATAQDPGAQASDPLLGLFEIESLDGSGNNRANPTWGQAQLPYLRVGPIRYADGINQPVAGPNVRYVSNRVFNDGHQNLFSERNVTQWAFAWGQFIDHTIGLRLGRAPGDPNGEIANIPFDSNDPIEEFTNTLGYMPFERSARAPGTGVTTPRQQVNTVGSYVDASAVYGDQTTRLEWLREGPVDGTLGNNSPRLLLPGGHLPRRDARGDPAAAPPVEINGVLLGHPEDATVAGDVRSNENLALTGIHTLFAREHNRIVAALPSFLPAEQRFEIARRVVIAEQQYITYNEFLPALGVRLPLYLGYRPNVNATLGNEFATVGYRAHSMIHGEFEMETEASRYTPEQLASFEDQGIEVAFSDDGSEVELAVPLNVAFFNPDLVEQLGLGPLMQGLGGEPQYKNDEQIDNQLRSVLFQVPVPGNPECLDGPGLPECFDGVLDLGAIDIERGRDHGMPSYNQLRQAFGLSPKGSFRAITGESTESFPSDPELTPGNEINDPDSLDIIALFDIDGNPIPLDSELAESNAVTEIRRTTVAARLKAIYGSVNNLDAFTGMLAERHVAGTDFGELQLAIWRRQFTALRDGDRFFHTIDPALPLIRLLFGIDHRRTLAQVIASNTDIPLADLSPNVFFVAEAQP
ncbi:MAG: hypothetical protein L0Y54_05090 [Sporichthyaceae bacterium]|nr:hypothetical protein [Sporichthyaceae bacterium]